MTAEQLSELKDLLKQLRKIRIKIQNLNRRRIIPEAELAEAEEKQNDLLLRMQPLQDQLRKDVAAFQNPYMKTSIRCYYQGESAKEIADLFGFAEAYIFRLIRAAERMVISLEQ